jgi:hypothetical protein
VVVYIRVAIVASLAFETHDTVEESVPYAEYSANLGCCSPIYISNGQIAAKKRLHLVKRLGLI